MENSQKEKELIDGLNNNSCDLSKLSKAIIKSSKIDDYYLMLYGKTNKKNEEEYDDIWNQIIIENGNNREELTDKKTKKNLKYFLRKVKSNMFKDKVYLLFCVLYGFSFGAIGLITYFYLASSISTGLSLLSFGLPFLIPLSFPLIDSYAEEKIYKAELKKMKRKLGIDIKENCSKEQELEKSKNTKVINDGILKEIYNLLDLISVLTNGNKLRFAKELKEIKNSYMALLKSKVNPDFKYTDQYLDEEKKIIDSLAKIELQIYSVLKQDKDFNSAKEDANTLDEKINSILNQEDDSYITINKEDLELPKKEHVLKRK